MASTDRGSGARALLSAQASALAERGECRWGIQKGYPVLPKSTNPERLRTNADVFSFRIDDADMALLETHDRGDGVAWAVGDPTKAA